MLQVNVDPSIVHACHQLARQIAEEVLAMLRDRTTIGIERAVLRLMGVSGSTDDERQVPLVNVLTDELARQGLLQHGSAGYLAYLNEYFNQPPELWLQAYSAGQLKLPPLQHLLTATYHSASLELATTGLRRIHGQRETRDRYLQRFGERPTPWLYVIVATGNIYEDLGQAEIAVRQGADVIAVIRSTAQSLLDYVPEGATTAGVAGTFATQENFRLMRQRLDELSEELNRYVRLTNYASGLCMAEMAALGGLERLDMMLSDSLYGILFRDINMMRTFTDQHFARRIQAYAGIIINTGEDNYLTTTEQKEEMHTVLASQFINRQFAHLAGLADHQIGLGHAYEMDPLEPDGLLYSLADALLSRQCFPACPLKYMPPTKHLDGNIFQAHVMNALFNLTSVVTRQHIHLVGILSEAVHTPFIHERYLAMQSAQYVFNYAQGLSRELIIVEDGLINSRAGLVLTQARIQLQQIALQGLPTHLEQGLIAGVKRTVTGGKGGEGVIGKSKWYFNPFDQLLPS